MLHLRIYSPSAVTDDVLRILGAESTVGSLAVLRDASLQPPGDVVMADVARERANEVIMQLRSTGVEQDGAIQIEPVGTWISRGGLAAEREAPGYGVDAVVWAEVVQRAYEESELTFTYLTFMTLATLIASIALVLDSQVLIIGAMVLGPEFVAVAALGIALVRRRRGLLWQAVRSLVVGFGVAIALTTLVVLAGRAAGWVSVTDITGLRPATSFVHRPDHWSFLVALLAGAAGVLSMTSARANGLVGVFISVTTIPAAGNVALGLAFGVSSEVRGSAAQLGVNIVGMAFAGWVTLAMQQFVWSRVDRRRRRRALPGDRTARPDPGRHAR